MKRLLIAISVALGISLVGVGVAQACGHGCSAPVVYAPASSGTVAQAQPATGYRTYSYQPGYQPSSYSPSYRSFNRSVGGGFHDAGWKIRGGN